MLQGQQEDHVFISQHEDIRSKSELKEKILTWTCWDWDAVGDFTMRNGKEEWSGFQWPVAAWVLVVAEVAWRGRLRMLSWHHFPHSPPAFLLPGIPGSHWTHSDVTLLPIAKLPSSNICTTYSLSHFIMLPAPMLSPPRVLKIITCILQNMLVSFLCHSYPRMHFGFSF